MVVGVLTAANIQVNVILKWVELSRSYSILRQQ